jgi:hypothetical protein
VSYYGSEIDQEIARIVQWWVREARLMFACGIVIGWGASTLLWWWDGVALVTTESKPGSEPLVMQYGPSHSCGLTYMPAVRHLPRIRLRRNKLYWEARWISQNDSFLAQEAKTPLGAIAGVVRWARYQSWPLWAWVGQ